jgi:glycogen operon protein
MYRDSVRDFWRGEVNTTAEFAERFTGSADLYKNDYRRPTASVNFITAHDGFTLHDLVSYNEKHNEANLDNNCDGETHNRSCNCGVEGETDDPEITSRRNRIKRSMLSTLFLSQGVPMLLSGDEFGNSQGGNNNVYCQDTEISWLHWDKADRELLLFTQNLIRFRKEHPVFTRSRWFRGAPIRGVGVEDIAWFLPTGKEMTNEDWKDVQSRAFGVFFNGLGLRCLKENGEKLTDDHFYIMFNAHDQDIEFVLPTDKYGKTWVKMIDTPEAMMFPNEDRQKRSGDSIIVKGLSVLVLQEIEREAIDTRKYETLPAITEP